MKVRKRPIVVEAIQFTEANMDEISRLPGVTVSKDGDFAVATLEGYKPVSLGYWVMRGIKHELYPCESSIFDLTYEVLGTKVPTHG